MTDFIGENLAGSRFENVRLSGAVFRDVDLTGARLHLVDLTGTVIRGTVLVNVEQWQAATPAWQTGTPTRLPGRG